MTHNCSKQGQRQIKFHETSTWCQHIEQILIDKIAEQILGVNKVERKS